MSFRELQQKCKDYGLEPCAGKGITKKVLAAKVAVHEAEVAQLTTKRHASEWETEIAESNFPFYQQVKDLVANMPDFRPQETVAKMKRVERGGEMVIEPQDNWRKLYDELAALSRPGEEGDADRSLLDAINSNNDKKLLSFGKDQKLLIHFFDTYPAIVWLSSQTSNVIDKLRVMMEDLDAIREIRVEDVPAVIPFIQSAEVASILRQKDPRDINQKDFNLWVKKGDVGRVRWALFAVPKDDVARELLSYQRDRLFDAVKSKNAEMVRLIMEESQRLLGEYSGVDISRAIIAAIRLQDEETVRILLETYKGISYASRYLQEAAGEDNKAILELLVDKYPNEISQVIVSHAISSGKTDNALFLIKKYHFDSEEHAGWVLGTLASEAIRYGNITILRYLLSDPRTDFRYILDPHVATAAERGDVDIITILLATPGFSIGSGILTPATNSLPVLSLLLSDWRFDPSYDNNNAIRFAFNRGHLKAVEMLLNEDLVQKTLPANLNKQYSDAVAQIKGSK